MMNRLFEKYKLNELKVEELKELRNHDSDITIMEQLQTEWMEREIDDRGVDTRQMERMKRRIDQQIDGRRTNHFQVRRLLNIAAIVLFSVMGASLLYFINVNRQLASREIIFTTNLGEKATVTLPDGSQVHLNSNSNLTYLASDYNRQTRTINFEGEGYFDIASDRECPFIVKSEGVEVSVLGTRFNFFVRENRDLATLFLESGSVRVRSTLSDEQITLKPSQKITIDRLNGRLEVHQQSNQKENTSWTNNQLAFENQPLNEVLEKVADNYGITILLKKQSLADESFTGTLSILDLKEVITVIEQSFHLKAIWEDDVITLDTRE